METAIAFGPLRPIYQGIACTIFEGADLGSGLRMAVKVLQDEFPSAQAMASLNREQEIGKRLSHIAGVRKVLGRQLLDRHQALTMAYIEGSTFRSLIDDRVLDGGQFLRLAVRTTAILHEIHACGIIHKDINPRNLLLGSDGEVYVIDLGIATIAQKERAEYSAPEHLEGTLAYISPEQTGRVNQSIDTRSDLYSWGATCYEMLAGQPPFAGADSMELVHCHIAKVPASPHEINPAVPSILSAIVMKLLAKNSEERYQTALGLLADLAHCQEVWEAGGDEALASLSFPIGARDVSTAFRIPEKLYGREAEEERLREAYAQVQSGGFGFVSIGGYSGVGKTALVNSLYRPVAESRGYFVSGKFEQFQRDVPYSAMVGAIEHFVQQLLGEPRASLERWKDRILEALGKNAGVLTELAPGLSWIIGPQEPAQPLPPVESQNRFNVAIQRFFRAISQADHPLAIFIDDWQWADLPSLHLLKLLASDTQNAYLLLLAAYRDNEVDASHPFALLLEELARQGQAPERLLLRPLEGTHIRELLADTLGAPESKVATLARLVEEKTSGNPFFVSQFLHRIHESGHIAFDSGAKAWKWDVKAIARLPISNSVLDLMSERIRLLPPETQRLLQTASCIGASFPLKLLAQLCGLTQAQARNALLPALDQGLVISQKGSHYAISEASDEDMGIAFRFLHDRVAQAAYEMLEEEAVKRYHWIIGQTLLETTPESHLQENLFDIVNFLNHGLSYASSKQQLAQLASLNYVAGKKAKKATAYSTAIGFLHQAGSLLGDKAWEDDYERMFDIYRGIGEAAFLTGDFGKSTQYLTACVEKAKSNEDKASIYKIQIAQLSGQGKYPDAVEMAIQAVGLFGMQLPSLSDTTGIQQLAAAETNAYIEYVREQGIERLAMLPECTNRDIIAPVELLVMALDCAAIGIPSVLGLFAMKITNLSIQHGLSPHSITSFIFGAMIYGAGFKDFKSAYEISSLSLRLALEREDAQHLLPKVFHIYAYFAYLAIPLEEAGHYNRLAFEKGMEVGDFVYGSYGMVVEPRFIYPYSLSKGMEKTLTALQFCQKINNLPMVVVLRMQIGFLKALQLETASAGTFDYEDFSEAYFMEIFGTTAPLLVAIYKRYKLQAAYLFDCQNLAWQLLQERDVWISIMGGIDIGWRVEYYLYVGLVAASVAHAYPLDQCIEALEEARRELQLLSENNPSIAATARILDAEHAWRSQAPFEAINQYDLAIELAGQSGIVQYAALAAERAMTMMLAHQKTDIARLYYQKALYAYEAWGAAGKMRQLREKYAAVFPFASQRRSAPAPGVTQTFHSILSGGNELDLLSVMKASQAISQEIKLDLLLKKMVGVLMENAGADRGLILQEQEEKFLLAAEAWAGKEEVAVMRELPLGPQDAQRMAMSVVRNVYRTQKTVVLDDAQKDARFAADPYVKQGKVRSLLCLPILHQGKVRAAVYMEHSQIAGAFTPDRLQVLGMLSAQVAISIENARLYDTMEQQVEARTAEVVAQQRQVAQSYQNVLLLSDIGKKITHHISVEKIIDTVYEAVNQLMPAEGFGIGVFNAKLQRIEFPGYIEKGAKLPFHYDELHDNDSLSDICFNRQQEIFINDMELELSQYLAKRKVVAGEATQSLIYLPLVIAGKGLGTITVQSFRKQAYSTHHLYLLRNIATYVAIALENAMAYARVEEEMEKSERLLLNILPKQTAAELKEKGHASPRYYDHATVLFTDFKDFTEIASKMSPSEVVSNLNQCFTAFDEITKRHGLEKIKTIGDAYMCASGLPLPLEDHAQRAVMAALDMVAFIREWRREKMDRGEMAWEVRVGLHSGALVAGVVGKEKFAYDIWGDTVNMAARMESASLPGKINLSQATYELLNARLPAPLHFEFRGHIDVKGKSNIGMWFVGQ